LGFFRVFPTKTCKNTTFLTYFPSYSLFFYSISPDLCFSIKNTLFFFPFI
jgi:hypothetical protein